MSLRGFSLSSPFHLAAALVEGQPAAAQGGKAQCAQNQNQGAGEAVDVDAEGRLVVRTDAGEQHVFTGEVSVHGIYGAG